MGGAARGLVGRRFPWGNVYNPTLANHGRIAFDELDDNDGFLELAPVGSFPDGRTPEGIEDLAGNAAEWVADWYAPQYPPKRRGAEGPRGERRSQSSAAVAPAESRRGCARGSTGDAHRVLEARPSAFAAPTDPETSAELPLSSAAARGA